MKLNPHLRLKPSRSRQRGYVLIVLLLALAVMVIGLTAVAPAMATRVRRQREIELIHRGKQYARAIRLFYRKFGRYPARLEELENTNNIRFLRKRYKDPMTAGGDWRLIHYGEAQLTMPTGSPLMPGATQPGAAGTGAAPGVAGAGNSNPFANTFSSGSSIFGQNNAAAPSTAQAATSTGGSTTTSGSTDSSQAGQSGQSSGQPGQPGQPASQLSSSLGNGPQFGGGPIVGVASTSKKESIKILNKKSHYNDWEFVYDPSLDMTMGGGLGVPLPGQNPAQNPLAPGGIQIGPGSSGPGNTPMQGPVSK